MHDSYGIPGANPRVHSIETNSGLLWEVPPSTCEVGWMRVPVGGGGYFRLFPYRVFRWLLKQVEREGSPLVMYFHPWELDPDQPRMKGSLLSNFRHYVNIQETHKRMVSLLQDFDFSPIRSLVPSLNSPVFDADNKVAIAEG